MQGRKFATTLTVREDVSYQDVKMLIFVQAVPVNFLSRIAVWQKPVMEHEYLIARVDKGITRWLTYMQQFYHHWM